MRWLPNGSTSHLAARSTATDQPAPSLSATIHQASNLHGSVKAVPSASTEVLQKRKSWEITDTNKLDASNLLTF